MAVARLMDYTLIMTRFLDIALICEATKDFNMAEKAAAKAVQVKKDAQGEDFPDYKKYADVLERVRIQLGRRKV